jgi:hypothetical protein
MRGALDVIGPKYAIRLGDLREWHRIDVKCFRCGRVGVLYPATASSGSSSPACAGRICG